MDAITREMLERLSAQHPNKVIHLTHQFLDGYDGKACGFVPAEWSGKTVTVSGQWWAKTGEVRA